MTAAHHLAPELVLAGPPYARCTACNGTGLAARHVLCRPCHGAGTIALPCPCQLCTIGPIRPRHRLVGPFTPGPPIEITRVPGGRRADVLVSTGGLIDGYLALPGALEVRFRGPEIRFRTVNPDGRVVFSADHKQQLGPAEGGGYSLLKPDALAVTEVRFVGIRA